MSARDLHRDQHVDRDEDAPHIRLGDDLDEPHPGAIEVHDDLVPVCAAHAARLGRVLLELDLVDADVERAGGRRAREDGEPASGGEWVLGGGGGERGPALASPQTRGMWEDVL